MTTTTHYAAIDATNLTGCIYGVGTTPAAALAEALRGGDPCVSHEERDPSHRPEDHFQTVPCTADAARYVETYGGAPSSDLSVSRRGVSLREEE
jgi:hypothetical protein